jgi:galactokinase
MDMRDLQTESVRIPDGVRIAVLDTRTKRAVAKSAYADRVAECQRAIELLRADGADVRSLRDATREQVEGLRERNAVAYRRARHVVTENERVLAAVEALRSEDFEALGNLFSASHASLRDDYEVSCPELDAMVEAAQAAPGCIGVRMTGAGFGGCCVALVYEKRAAEFLEATAAGYCTHGFEKPDLRLTHAGNGVQTSKYS